MYAKVQQISVEVEDDTEKDQAQKDSKKADQDLLNGYEKRILSSMAEGYNGTKKRSNDNTSATVKNADGSITVDTERVNKKLAKVTTLEGSFLAMIQYEMKTKIDLEAAAVVSEQTKQCLIRYMETSQFCDETFLQTAFANSKKGPPEYLSDEFNTLGGISGIVDFFCQKEVMQGGADKFVEILLQMDVQPKESRLLYRFLLTMKTEALAAKAAVDAVQKANIPIAVSTTNSSNVESELTTVVYGEDDMNFDHLDNILLLPVPHLHEGFGGDTIYQED